MSHARDEELSIRWERRSVVLAGRAARLHVVVYEVGVNDEMEKLRLFSQGFVAF
jgi:hypothetical protein